MRGWGGVGGVGKVGLKNGRGGSGLPKAGASSSGAWCPEFRLYQFLCGVDSGRRIGVEYVIYLALDYLLCLDGEPIML